MAPRSTVPGTDQERPQVNPPRPSWVEDKQHPSVLAPILCLRAPIRREKVFDQNTSDPHLLEIASRCDFGAGEIDVVEMCARQGDVPRASPRRCGRQSAGLGSVPMRPSSTLVLSRSPCIQAGMSKWKGGQSLPIPTRTTPFSGWQRECAGCRTRGHSRGGRRGILAEFRARYIVAAFSPAAAIASNGGKRFRDGPLAPSFLEARAFERK